MEVGQGEAGSLAAAASVEASDKAVDSQDKLDTGVFCYKSFFFRILLNDLVAFPV